MGPGGTEVRAAIAAQGQETSPDPANWRTELKQPLRA